MAYFGQERGPESGERFRAEIDDKLQKLDQKVSQAKARKQEAKDEIKKEAVGPKRRKLRKEKREAAKEARKLERKSNKLERLQQKHQRRDELDRDTTRVEKRVEKITRGLDLSVETPPPTITPEPSSPNPVALDFKDDFWGETPQKKAVEATSASPPEVTVERQQQIDFVNRTLEIASASGQQEHPLYSILQSMAVGFYSNKPPVFSLKKAPNAPDVQEVWDTAKPPVLLGAVSENGVILTQNKQGEWVEETATEPGSEAMVQKLHTARLELISRWLPTANPDELRVWLPRLATGVSDKAFQAMSNKKSDEFKGLVANLRQNPQKYTPELSHELVTYLTSTGIEKKREHSERLTRIQREVKTLQEQKKWDKIKQIALVFGPSINPRAMEKGTYLERDIVSWLLDDLVTDADFFSYTQGIEAERVLHSNTPYKPPEPLTPEAEQVAQKKSGLLRKLDKL